MKRKTILIISLIAIVVYLPFAPVFITSEFGTQPNAILSVDQCYSYFWITRRDSFTYFILFGLWNYRIQDNALLMFRDEKGTLSQILLGEAHLFIDGAHYQIADLVDTSIKMDSGPFNGYGGNGASGNKAFSLPLIPKKIAQIDVKGETVDVNGNRTPFSISVRSHVKSESSIIPLFKYFYGELTET